MVHGVRVVHAGRVYILKTDHVHIVRSSVHLTMTSTVEAQTADEA